MGIAEIIAPGGKVIYHKKFGKQKQTKTKKKPSSKYTYYPEESKYNEPSPVEESVIQYLPSDEQKEITARGLIEQSVIKEQQAKTEMLSTLSKIKLGATYEVEDPSGLKGKLVLKGTELIELYREEYGKYFSGQKTFREKISEYDPRTTFEITEKGFKPVSPPSMTSLIIERFEEKQWWEQKAAEVFAPVVQLAKIPIDIVSGIVSPTIDTWKDPTTGRIYYKQKLIIGYRPIKTYYDPYTGEQYIREKGQLKKIDESFIEFAEITHKLPTMLDVPFSKIPSFVPIVGSTSEQRERAKWVEQRISEDPTSIITMGAGEIITMWGFGQAIKPVATVVSPYISKYIKEPLKAPFERFAGGVKTSIYESYPYLPRSVRGIGTKLFRPAGFHLWEKTSDVGTYGLEIMGKGTEWTYHRFGKMGIISKFILESPKRAGFKFIYPKTLYGIELPTKEIIYGLRWEGEESTTGWGVFRGYTYETTTKLRTKLFNLPFLISKEGKPLIIEPGIMTRGFTKTLQQPGTTIGSFEYIISQGKGYISKISTTTISEPKGFMFWKGVDITTKEMGISYINVDPFIPGIIQSIKTTPKMFGTYMFGDVPAIVSSKTITPMSKTIDASIVIKKQYPLTASGIQGSAEYRGFAPENIKMVSTRWLDYLEELEFGTEPYKTLIYPTGKEKIIRIVPEIGADVLGGATGEIIPPIYDAYRKSKHIYDVEKIVKTKPEIDTDVDKYLQRMPVTTIFPIIRTAPQVISHQTQYQDLEQIQITDQAQKLEQLQILESILYTPSKTTKYPFFYIKFKPKDTKGGGAGTGSFLSYDIFRMRVHPIKFPTVKEALMI